MSTADFLGIDLGAESGRVVLARWNGARFALDEIHRFPNHPVTLFHALPIGSHPANSAPEESLHWNVLGLWAGILDGLGEYAARHLNGGVAGNTGGTLAGIGIDTWGVDFALLDRRGRLLGPPYHYRDARNNGMEERLFACVDAAEIFDLTGIQFMQINTLYQLYAMRHYADPQLDMASMLLMMPDLFHYWLTGVMAGEYTIASTSQMLHAADRNWATRLLARLDLPTQILPPLVAPGTTLGPLLPAVAQAAGLPGDTPVIAPGGHDTASAVAAIPGLDADSVYISSGTWSLMGVEIPAPIVNEQVRALNFTNEGGVDGTIRLLKNIGGLWLLQECRRHWARAGQNYSWDDLLVRAEAAEPFRSLVNPDAPEFLNPDHMIEAICAACIATGQPAPESVGQVVRCCLESLALRYRWTLDALEQLTERRLGVIRIVGGGSQNRLLCRMTADACGRPVVAGPVEATALGNIMIQAIASGHIGSLAQGREAIAVSVELGEYAPQAQDGWDEAYQRFLALLG
jgi:rhamnulokinase